MTATTTRAAAPSPLSLAELRPTSWHRPLLLLAIAMGLLVLANLAGVFIDSREVTGADVWLKPLKFAISTGIYALSLAWLIGRLPKDTRLTRLAGVAGTVATVGLAIELALINGFALAGETSHFNVTTPLHATAWSVMATSIVVVWVMTFLVAVLLFRAPLGDRARTLAIRGGTVLALVGMGLAFLMTGPTGDQLADFQGIAGAHTVGVADGGPGLPLLGWSTVAGDLRIPHFIGMHALQVLPLFVLLLEVLALRVARLREPVRRRHLVVLALVTYAAALVLVTVQALIGQSIVAPSGPILVSGVALTVLVAGSGVGILLAPPRLAAIATR